MKIGLFLSQHARRVPGKPAVILGKRMLTFGMLDEQSNRMANALLAKGLKPGDRVALYVGNTIELVVAVAALWKAGALPIPITTWTVGRELAFVVDDAKPFAILYGTEQAEQVASAKLPDNVLHIVTEDKDHAISLASLIETDDDTAPPALPPEPDDAMISYTSGTTGKPKGAILTHANLVTAQLLFSTVTGLSGNDIYMIMTPIAHRVGMARLVACFCMGATVIVMPRFNPADAIALIKTHQVSVISLVPTVARLLVETIEVTAATCGNLRTITATGEAFPENLKARIARVLPHVDLWVMYGMTEGGIPAAIGPLEQKAKPGSVGRPMPGVEIRLVDAAGAEVAKGESGE
ncbi:MAG: class I adenylate-forming enzyme family protein, partial [Pseudomonadota bacterium]|nr:class I adenylate-forming enzyme family protein [Pseudomonadota bacterium]